MRDNCSRPVFKAFNDIVDIAAMLGTNCSIRQGSSCPSSVLFPGKARPAVRFDGKALPWWATDAPVERWSKAPGPIAIPPESARP